MAFIRLQNIVENAEGRIVSGSASIVDVVYTGVSGDRTRGHSKQVVRERLGRPLHLSQDRRSGIFLSEVRGVVSYDVDRDEFGDVAADDPRIADAGLSVPPALHAVFGDGLVFLRFLESTGLGPVLRGVFPKKADLQRCMAHLYHTVARNGEKVRCDVFLERSFLRSLVPEVPVSCLKSDSPYFAMMGDDDVKMRFFKAYVEHMRKAFPEFGKVCYVDSTPLPNDIDDHPFDAFSSHGTGSSDMQMRMAMVLDSASGLPVWFDFFPGNVLDLNTLESVTANVEGVLGVRISEYVLDAGYASRDLVLSFPDVGSDGDGDVRNVVVRMPARRGYPYRTLYSRCRPLMSNGKYDFLRGRHAYFGVRRDAEVFGRSLYAYVYVDYDNALRGYRRYMADHKEEYEKLTDREKTWHRYCDGYFVLMSSIAEDPDRMLDRYFGRTRIECVFKTAKEYLDVLPLRLWTVETVRGKVLNDVMALILYLGIRRGLRGSPYSVPEVFSRARSLMCTRTPDGTVVVDAPNRQLKAICGQLGIPIPSRVTVSDFPGVRSRRVVLKSEGT